MPWIHRVLSNLKRFGLGVYHGFRKKYLQAYLDEFVFQVEPSKALWSFDSLLGIGIGVGHFPLTTLRAC
jgi:ISXO2-like transposase domain